MSPDYNAIRPQHLMAMSVIGIVYAIEKYSHKRHIQLALLAMGAISMCQHLTEDRPGIPAPYPKLCLMDGKAWKSIDRAAALGTAMLVAAQTRSLSRLLHVLRANREVVTVGLAAWLVCDLGCLDGNHFPYAAVHITWHLAAFFVLALVAKE